MRKVIFSLSSMLLLLVASTQQLQAQSNSSIQWHRSEQSALEQASHEDKPVVLFFTGTGWCGWCTKLEQEVLHRPEFLQEASRHFVFAVIDFPQHGGDAAQQQQNRALMQKYGVRGFPTLVILDSHGNLLGKAGYKAGGPQPYLQNLKQIAGVK